ncbi:hypothetical protein LSAT2_002067 [Lamellibrachia satsuma]|nr:hypothetical protein LSAT2_002067 [Lamellibrachia satsuma]
MANSRKIPATADAPSDVDDVIQTREQMKVAKEELSLSSSQEELRKSKDEVGCLNKLVTGSGNQGKATTALPVTNRIKALKKAAKPVKGESDEARKLRALYVMSMLRKYGQPELWVQVSQDFVNKGKLDLSEVLSSTNLPDLQHLLQSGEASDITKLYLSGNAVFAGEEAGRAFGAALAKMSQLCKLRLSRCHLKDQSWADIANGIIGGCQQLETLYCSSNNLTDDSEEKVRCLLTQLPHLAIVANRCGLTEPSKKRLKTEFDRRFDWVSHFSVVIGPVTPTNYSTVTYYTPPIANWLQWSHVAGEDPRSWRSPLSLRHFVAINIKERVRLYDVRRDFACRMTVFEMIHARKSMSKCQERLRALFQSSSGDSMRFTRSHTLRGRWHLHPYQIGRQALQSSSPKAKSKIRKVLIRELLFADDAALSSHSTESLQRLIERFADACKEFSLTISIKKTNIMGQDVRNAPSININEHTLQVVQYFTYLSSTITSNLSTDVEINKRTGKVSSAMSIMTNRVWENCALTLNTRVQMYKACVLSILLSGSETWTT